MATLLYEEITFDIRGVCYEIWNAFGSAFKEKAIEKALSLGLQENGRKVETQKRVPISFLGQKIGVYVPDLIVDGKVLVELKSKPFIAPQDIDQFWKYLKSSDYRLGLLINFGPKGLEIKRIVYDSKRDQKSIRVSSAPVSASIPREKVL